MDRKDFQYGAFVSGDLEDVLQSLSGKTPVGGKTIGSFRNAAHRAGGSTRFATSAGSGPDGNGGSGYDQSGWFQLTYIQAMYVLKYKNLNSQEAVGMGNVNSSVKTTGNTNDKGLNYGTTDSNVQMKLFGLEDFWGNVYEWIDGVVTDSSRNALTATQGFNDSGSGYTNQGQTATSDISIYSWKAKVCGTSEKGFISTATAGGSESTYWCDVGSTNSSRVPRFGGAYAGGNGAGVFHFHLLESASGSMVECGARLMYL